MALASSKRAVNQSRHPSAPEMPEMPVIAQYGCEALARYRKTIRVIPVRPRAAATPDSFSTPRSCAL